MAELFFSIFGYLQLKKLPNGMNYLSRQIQNSAKRQMNPQKTPKVANFRPNPVILVGPAVIDASHY